LFCLNCNCKVNHERLSPGTKHCESKKYFKSIKNIVQTIIPPEFSNKNEFTSYVVKAFFICRHSYYKANNIELKSLFSFLGRPLSSKSSLRAHVASIVDFETLKVHNFISGKKCFKLSMKVIFLTKIFQHIGSVRIIWIINNKIKKYIEYITQC